MLAMSSNARPMIMLTRVMVMITTKATNTTIEAKSLSESCIIDYNEFWKLAQDFFRSNKERILYSFEVNKNLLLNIYPQ